MLFLHPAHNIQMYMSRQMISLLCTYGLVPLYNVLVTYLLCWDLGGVHTHLKMWVFALPRFPSCWFHDFIYQCQISSCHSFGTAYLSSVYYMACYADVTCAVKSGL